MTDMILAPCLSARRHLALVAVTLGLVAEPAAAVEFDPNLAAELRQVTQAVAAAPGDAGRRLPLVASGPDIKQFGQRLDAAGVASRQIGPLIRFDMPVAGLGWLAGPEQVRVHRGARLFPLLDASADAMQLTPSLRSQRTGRDVIVAILDTGIDFTHPDFLNPDGSSRLIAYWDQTAADEDNPFGIFCDAQDINNGDCPNRADEPLEGFSPLGHGTHVAGIAVGNDPRFLGVAPEAMLVGVRIVFDEIGLIDGMAWVDELARRAGKPAVINMSLGSNDGGHDGGAPSEQVVDALSGPGRLFVSAAGNEAPTASQGEIHAAGLLDGQERRARFVLGGFSSPSEFHVEIWADQGDGLVAGIALEDDPSSGIGTILDQTGLLVPDELPAVGRSIELDDGDGDTFQVIAFPVASPGNGEGIRFRIAEQKGSTGSFNWQVYFSGATGVADAWLTDRIAYFEPTSGPQVIRFADDSTADTIFVPGDGQRIVTLPGTARRGIAVSSFVSRVAWNDVNDVTVGINSTLGQRSDISSIGPTRDGRLKPEITAPGEMIASSLATTLDDILVSSNQQLDDNHWVQRGTSMATPHVAGVAALIMQGNPGLTPSAFRQVLRELARTDADTGATPNTSWGYGKLSLNGIAGLDAWDATTRDTVAPAVTSVVVSATDRGVLVEWLTDELADSRVTADDRIWTVGSFGYRHQVRLTSPLPERVQVSSADPAGNIGTFADGTVAVPPAGCGCRSGASPTGGLPLAIVFVIWFWLRHAGSQQRRQATVPRSGKDNDDGP